MKGLGNLDLISTRGLSLCAANLPLRSAEIYAAEDSVLRSCFSCSEVLTGGLQLNPEHTTAVVLPALTAGNSGTVAASDGGKFCATAWLNFSLITERPKTGDEIACE